MQKPARKQVRQIQRKHHMITLKNPVDGANL